MREILFRGKRLDNGEWIEGDFVEKLDPLIGTPSYFIVVQGASMGMLDSLCTWHLIDIKTIGQYTGLTDKNGNKIFEGDICRNTKTNEIVSVKWHGTMACYVWSKRKADNGNLYDFGELFRAFDKYEVIGNIHDNPELMGGAENVSHP